MIPGTIIMDDLTVYTDWMPREADNLIIQFEVLDLSTTPAASVDLKFYTKSADTPNSTGTGVTQLQSGTTFTLDSAGLYEVKLDGAEFEDEFRIKFAGTPGSGDKSWLQFRIVEMIWYDSAT